MARAARRSLPTSAGTYVLILEALATRRVQVGALGTLDLKPGFYAYVGSARGSGGLSGRLSHHRRRSRSPHWHIDYLRRACELREVWLGRGAAEWEHRWAEILGSGSSSSIPLARFGASDCRCRSHLYRFSALPRVSAFRKRLATSAGSISPAPPPEVVRWLAV